MVRGYSWFKSEGIRDIQQERESSRGAREWPIATSIAGSFAPTASLATSLSETLHAAPKCFVTRGESKMFTSSDIKAMSDKNKLLPQIEEATKLMGMAREWLQGDVVLPEVSKMLGDLDVRMCMHVHRFAKKVKTRTQLASLTKIAETFALEAMLFGTDMRNCPWTPPEQAPTEDRASRPDMVELGKGGSIDVRYLNWCGFNLGVKCKSKIKRQSGEKPVVYHIAGMNGTEISFMDGSVKTLTVSAAELLDTHRIVKIAEDQLCCGILSPTQR